jgi:hypothetical protein
VKIGLVRASERRNSFNRLREHQTGNPRALQILKKEIISTQAVDRVEALLHRLYAKQRVSGEWFEFKSELQVQEAIKRTKVFAKEVAKIVPVFDEAEALSKAQDNDKSIPATDQHKKLLETIAIANLEISEIKVLESVIDAKFAEAVKAGVSGMDKVVKTQIRTIKPFLTWMPSSRRTPKSILSILCRVKSGTAGSCQTLRLKKVSRYLKTLSHFCAKLNLKSLL